MIKQLFLLIVTIALSPLASAQLKIDINRGSFKPLPIAIPAFNGDTSSDRSLGENITKIVKSDLESSGLFRALPKNSFIEQDLKITSQPRFRDWSVIQAEALTIGHVSIGSSGHLTVQMRLFDVFGQKQIFSKEYTPAESENWRHIAHKIADAIYERLTGDKGYFNTRIVFIAESGPRSKRVRRLAVMDQDGANTKFLTDGRFEVLTPRFSPTSQTLIYTALIADKTKPDLLRRQVFLYNLRTEKKELIGNFDGMSFAARFAPDGESVVMSLEADGNSDIFLMQLGSGKRKRLTFSSAIDTSPSFSPDGKYVVFNSDRGGSPQLYVIRTNRAKHKCPSGKTEIICRVSFGKGRYSTPVWSPRGDLIAFTKQTRGQFYIGVIKPNGRNERLITKAYLDEGPTWSPNGRVIAFFRETAAGIDPRLWSIDLSGRNLRLLPTPGAASDPAWSPLLQ